MPDWSTGQGRNNLWEAQDSGFASGVFSTSMVGAPISTLATNNSLVIDGGARSGAFEATLAGIIIEYTPGAQILQSSKCNRCPLLRPSTKGHPDVSIRRIGKPAVALSGGCWGQGDRRCHGEFVHEGECKSRGWGALFSRGLEWL